MNLIPFDLFDIINEVCLVFEAFLGIWLLRKSFLPKPLKNHRLLTFIYTLLYIIMMLFQHSVLSSMIKNTYFVYLGFHFIMLFFYGYYFCEGKLYFKFFYPLVYLSILTLASNPLSLVLSLLSELLPTEVHISMNIARLLNNVVIIPILFFMLHYKLDTQRTYPVSFTLTMILTPLLNTASMTLLKPPAAQNIALTGSIALFLQLLIYYMIWQSTNEYDQRIHLQLIQQQHQYHAQHLSELSDIVSDYRKLRHDMKNHFACMDRLLSQEKYRTLKDYFYSMCNDVYAIDNQIETGNEIINQVINIKYATASRLKIPMNIQSALPEKLEIPDYILCSVLSNLLDNAIEASAKISKPEITVKLHMVKEYLSLTIKNNIEPWQTEHAKNRITTKSNSELHGLGLQIVEDTVNKFNGISTFEISDDMYMASVMLENISLGSEK